MREYSSIETVRGLIQLIQTALKDKQDKFPIVPNSILGYDENGYMANYTHSQLFGSSVINFTTSSSRENITTGDSIQVILGKITRYFNDLKQVAFSASYNDFHRSRQNRLQEVGKTDFKKSGKPTSRGRENRLQQVGKTDFKRSGKWTSRSRRI